MVYNAHGYARVSARRPRAAGICDQCGMKYTHEDLRFQYQYAGNTLYNTGFLVCQECLDIPNPQLRARIIPPDPLPIMNPRPRIFNDTTPVPPPPPPPPPPPVDTNIYFVTPDGIFLTTPAGVFLIELGT